VSLEFKIADLTATPQHHRLELPSGWCAERAGAMFRPCAASGPVELTVVRNALVIEVEGVARAEVAFSCSRCAEAASTLIEAAFAHRFVGPGQLDAGDGSFDLFDADPDVSEHDGVHLSLDDLVIEHLLIELPAVPVCAESCRGLCPQCGANFNQETCGCAREPARASPWATLADFAVATKRDG